MKTNKLYYAAGSVLLNLAFGAGEGISQERSTAKLDEVVVTASRSPKKLSQVGKAVSIIDRETIEKSQGRTLPELLNNVAGLSIAGSGTNSGELKALYLRGASAANTLILLDGIPLNDASEISGEYNISAIPLEQIERIEIMKGGNSTLYGSDAVAGVINIITRREKGDLKASIIATGGSYDTYRQAITAGGGIGNTSITLGVSNLDTRGISTAIAANGSAAGFDRDAFHQQSALLNLDHNFSNAFSLYARLQANRNKADLDNGAFTDALDHTYDKKAFAGSIGGRIGLGKGLLNISYNQNTIRNFYRQDTETDNRGTIRIAEANYNTPFASFMELASGLSYRNAETRQKNEYSPVLNAENDLKSAFTSLFFASGPGFRAELGGRINDHSEYGSNFTYTINPSYLIAGKYRIYANASSGFRIPSLYQLFSEYGNLNLKPENSVTYEAGVDMALSRNLDISVAYFDREIEDVIDFGDVGGGRFGYINQNRQKDRGLETELRLQLNPNWKLTGFYAYVDGEVETPAGTFNNLFRRPKHSYGMNTDLKVSDQLTLALIFKHTGDRTERYFDNGTFTTVEAGLDSFNVLDAYLQYDLNRRISVFTDIKNLLDEDYVEFTGYQTKGLNFNAGLRLNL